jgi:hypothetical protein
MLSTAHIWNPFNVYFTAVTNYKYVLNTERKINNQLNVYVENKYKMNNILRIILNSEIRKTAGSMETLVDIYQTTSGLHSYRRENFRSHKNKPVRQTKSWL